MSVYKNDLLALVTREDFQDLRASLLTEISKMREEFKALLAYKTSLTAEGEPKQMYSVAELARVIGVDTSTVYRWLYQGTLQGTQQTGKKGRWLIPASELERLRASAEDYC